MPHTRVTVTLPADLVENIDRLEPNRSAFVLEAVKRELQRRSRGALRQSLRNPHPEARKLAELGFVEWASRLPAEDAELVDMRKGTPVRWTKKGWRKGKR
jgi:Arc/MetJ-type ribon-helix-helix transcriptional regulator